MDLFDFHVHSDISADSKASMIDMIRAEAAKGVKVMCFTNHCDMIDWHTNLPDDRCFSVPERTWEKKRELLELCPELPIDVRFGMELGEAHHNFARAEEIASGCNMDFIIGSVHILKNRGDFAFMSFSSEQECEEVHKQYLDELILLTQHGVFDVMGHIGYCLRSMKKSGFYMPLTVQRGGERLRTVLANIIDKGCGIEINCSGIRDGAEAFPNLEVLKLYRSLGGEILTIGSDAHRPSDAGAFVDDGLELAREAGFKYITLFKDRKPEFIKI